MSDNKKRYSKDTRTICQSLAMWENVGNTTGDHSFNTSGKFSEKLTFLTP